MFSSELIQFIIQCKLTKRLTSCAGDTRNFICSYLIILANVGHTSLNESKEQTVISMS